MDLLEIKSARMAGVDALLCRSTTCELKFSSVMAAVRVDLTQLRYGRNVLDWRRSKAIGQPIIQSCVSVSLVIFLTMLGCCSGGGCKEEGREGGWSMERERVSLVKWRVGL